MESKSYIFIFVIGLISAFFNQRYKRINTRKTNSSLYLLTAAYESLI
jgi:hypothetical protein